MSTNEKIFCIIEFLITMIGKAGQRNFCHKENVRVIRNCWRKWLYVGINKVPMQDEYEVILKDDTDLGEKIIKQEMSYLMRI